MHVVILAEFAGPSGGAEKVAVESARGLAEAGLEVTFIQGVEGPADPLLDHPRLRRVALELPDVWSRPALTAATAGIWHRAAAERLASALDGLPTRPDCLHLHQWTRSLSPSVFPLLLGTGAPVVVTLHDYFLACPNGVYYRFDRGEPCALRPLSTPCLTAPCDAKSRAHKLVRVARTAALRRAAGRNRLHLVHVCDATLARMGPMLAEFAASHHRIDNPVSVVRGEPAEPARGDAIAYVGRMTAEKGADLVAEAARAAGLPAFFIGSGPLEESLRGRPGIELLGWRSPAEVQAILRARARAVAAPSRWLETGPLTVYEALAAGIPVVASDRSGAAEKVRHGETGFVVPPEPAALTEAFRALRDDARVGALGRAAHARYWSAPLTVAAHCEALAALYARVRQRGLCAAQQPEQRDAADRIPTGAAAAECTGAARL
ncbi:glycosyltransferase [Methylobacterium oxalidis]|uniref:Polysaccharide biosynthesis protein n=1 Tax=Methylobacterium oxalidis TaxID=944322 RepID=A0A512IWS0_9HYPH|nr:glycosyltransferase [Methylobacterium oxalidis]GEP02145.1 polysaccharide biosynthesis protein [Methylobacterium oxalidis]GJE32111.1 D-inositol-3-phosphate glycosyltransferase [Methylobacterium oxalidis]GLS62090.1 polysaccharide biosynthesis protein [Methylobacterium oxalidis]